MAAVLAATACERSEDDYKDFAPGGEIVYAGKPDSVKVFPGNGRIQLYWLLTSDATIENSRIYWNRGRDSLNVTVKRTNGVDTIKVMLDNMEEGPYTFQVYNYNSRGNRSIKAEINGDVYGEFYERTLLNRLIKAKKVINGQLKLDWQDVDSRSVGVRIYYKDASGADKTWLVPATEKSTLLTELPLNNTFEYHTLYKPIATALDTFEAARVTVNF